MPFLRLISRLPLPAWYALAGLLGLLVFRVAGYRSGVARDNLARSFPVLDEVARTRLQRDFERGLAEVSVEVVKSLTLPRAALQARMSLAGLEAVEADLAAGRSVLLATAHCGNWEWLLLAMSASLKVPLDALYKPIKSAFTERFFRDLRGRFGARLVPAKDVMAELAVRRSTPRVLAMVADQVPASTPHRYWTKFLNQDTAFYLGLDDIARATGFVVYVVFAERVSRGHYRGEVRVLARPAEETLAPREISRRYAEALEAHLRAHPADWLWGHRRWKLKKPLYGR